MDTDSDGVRLGLSEDDEEEDTYLPSLSRPEDGEDEDDGPESEDEDGTAAKEQTETTG